MVTPVNMLLYAWKLLRANLKHSHLKIENLLSNGCMNHLDLGNHHTMLCQTIMLYTLNIYNYIYQLFLNGVKKKKKQETLHHLQFTSQKENRLGPWRVRWMEREWGTFHVFDPKYITQLSQSHTTSISNLKEQ